MAYQKETVIIYVAITRHSYLASTSKKKLAATIIEQSFDM